MCPVPKGRSGGSSWAQISWAKGQRVRKRQPEGGLSAEGSSPRMWPLGLARAAGHVGLGNGVDERPCVGMDRVLVHALGRADLDEFAQVHDAHRVGDVPHDRQVVGDHDVAELVSGLELLQQVEDLRLDRDVEGRDRLVGDDEAGFEREGPGQPDPLALAAGELVGIELARVRD